MKFAYFGLPHIGGTYTVFRQLHSGLAPQSIDVRWLGLGRSNVSADPAWRDEMPLGTLVDPHGALAPADQAAALLAEIEEGDYSGVFVNVLADQVQMNLARYLPRRILRIMIVHSITPGTYSAASSIRAHVHATVGVSERCRRDLVARCGFPPHYTFAIPNAVRLAVGSARIPDHTSGSLRMLFLGRIEDSSKGVLWLPDIVKGLAKSCTLTVAGDGPDLARLRERLRPYADRVKFAGAIAPDSVPSLMARHDVLIMPSRYEGFGLTLVEAMAMGCVPVASHIRGVTDTIVDHGVNGLLFPVGDWREAVRQIEVLRSQPDLFCAISSSACVKAASAFGVDRMADAYAQVIARVAADPPVIAEPLRPEDWSLPAGLRPGLRTYLPPRVKNWLRVIRERF